MNAARTIDIAMSSSWNAFSDISVPAVSLGGLHVNRRADRVHRREQRHADQNDESDHGQDERAVNPSLLITQVHEDRGHHRSLRHRDDERDGDRGGNGQVDLIHRHRDDGKHEERRADHQVLPEAASNVAVIRHVLSSTYSRYKTGNKKIHTKSTKSQYNPVYSMRFAN